MKNFFFPQYKHSLLILIMGLIIWFFIVITPQNKPCKDYTVKLTTFLDHKYYHCDSINYITDNRIQLFNTGDKDYFIDIKLSSNTTLKITRNECN